MNLPVFCCISYAPQTAPAVGMVQGPAGGLSALDAAATLAGDSALAHRSGEADSRGAMLDSR